MRDSGAAVSTSTARAWSALGPSGGTWSAHQKPLTKALVMVAVLSLLIASATAFAIPATSINKPQLPLQSSKSSSPIAGAAPKYPRVLLCAATRRPTNAAVRHA